MTSMTWRFWIKLLCICSSLCAAQVGPDDFQLVPLNLSVLRGSDGQFNATVKGKWQVITWDVGGLQVLTLTAAGAIIPSADNFSANFSSSGSTTFVEFIIHNVTRAQSGQVSCTVQGLYGRKTAQLNVQDSGTVNIVGGNVTAEQDQQVEFQCETSAWFPAPTVSWTRNGEAVNSSLYNTTSVAVGDYFNSTSVLNFRAVDSTTVECWATVAALTDPLSSSVYLVVVPKPPDWTVLIAVVVPIGGFALLVLLILGIIYCYKYRKEKKSSYQDEMSRRVRTQSDAAGQRQGETNAGYVSDGQTSIAPSELTDSGFSQANGSNNFEAPEDLSSDWAGNAHNTVDELGFKKHRHVTIV